MKNLVSICALVALTLLQSCGSKSEPSAVMSLYQSDRALLDDSLMTTSEVIKVEERLKTTTVKLSLNWEKEWDNSPKAHLNIDRHHVFSLPATIRAEEREAFPGIAILDLSRPKSETALPKYLRCIYRQSANDQDYQFQFCVEKNAPITIDKLEKIKASAMNLIKREQREKISFELSPGDGITGFFAYPTSLENHGKTKNKYHGLAELHFLK